MKKPLFLDRDGVLNVDISPYVQRLEQFQIFPWTAPALALLHDAGFEFYVISNQQGVALRLTPLEELEKMNHALQRHLEPYGFGIRDFYYATALASEPTSRRKPSPDMVLEAARDHGLDVRCAPFIGDKWSDIECAVRAGCRPLLVLSGVTSPGESRSWRVRPEAEFDNLLSAARYLVGLSD